MRVRGSSRRWGIAVALGVMALAVSACGGSATPSGSPTPRVSLGPTPTEGPSVSIAPSTTAPTTGPSPTPVVNGPLADGSIATVAVDKLNLRAGADDSTAIRQTLKAGARLFVIGASKVVGNLRWQQVAVISPADCLGKGCGAIGWVATPTSGTDGWIAETTFACPSSPATAEEVAPLLPLEGLHCYGNREFTITGWIDTPCCGYEGPLTFSPAWLAAPASPFFRMQSGGEDLQPFRFAPGAGLELPDTTVIIRATAHFDDAAAQTCVAAVADGEVFDTALLPTRATMVLGCRTHLVITDFEVVGYLPGRGGCGCLPPSPKPAA